jgi:hypothetical protein
VKLKGVWILVLTLAAAAWIGFGAKLPNIDWPTPGPVTPTKPPLIVMLYEDSHGNLPPYAIGAANELTAAGREVRPIDDDVTTGLDTVPVWLKPALVPGRAIMGGNEDSQQKDDALILLDGERVLKAIKLPATKAEILEAVQ